MKVTAINFQVYCETSKEMCMEWNRNRKDKFDEEM